jgi:Cu-Zn family superoxide dismutase
MSMVRHLISIRGAMLILCGAMASGSCVSEEPAGEAVGSTQQNAAVRTAAATLRDQNGVALATVVFTTVGTSTLVAVAAHLPAGVDTIHGLHVHANDNPANGDGCIADPTQPPNTFFVSADGHFNPGAATHGNHAGDMPPLFVAASGNTATTFLTDRFTPGDVKGRAVIMHAGSDNLGNVPVGVAVNQYTPNAPDATTLTANTGNAGNRIACGVIQ